MQWSESIYCWKLSLIWPNRISQDALVWLIVHGNTGRRGLIWIWSKCWSNADVGDIIGILGLKCLTITMKKWLSYASTICTSTISIYLITKKLFSIYVNICDIYEAHIVFEIIEIISWMVCFHSSVSNPWSFDYSKHILEIFHLLLSFIGEAREFSSLSSTWSPWCVPLCCCCFSEPFPSCRSIGITRRVEEL